MIPQWSLNNLSVIFSKNVPILERLSKDNWKTSKTFERSLRDRWKTAERPLKDHFHERLPIDYSEPFQEILETMKFTERSWKTSEIIESSLKDHWEICQFLGSFSGLSEVLPYVEWGFNWFIRILGKVVLCQILGSVSDDYGVLSSTI